MTDKYEEVLSGIRSEIKTLNGGKELFYKKNYARIGINTDDDLPSNNFQHWQKLSDASLKKVKNCIHKFF